MESTKFAENLRMAFSESIYDFAVQNHETDGEYKKAKKEYVKTFDLLRSKLGGDEELLIKLYDLETELNGIDEEFIYLQGFVDCVYLLKLINLL